MAAEGWSAGQRRLHWAMAALVVTGAAVAWAMVRVPLRDLLAKFLLYQLHKTIGLLVLALLVVRLVLRLRRGRPAWDASLGSARRRLAAGVHAGLYLLLGVVPVLGYLVAATAPVQVPTLFLGVVNVPHLVGPDPDWYAVLAPLHRAAAVTLLALAAGHAAIGLASRRALVAIWRG